MIRRAAVIRADARNLPLPDASVDLICTSPPYFGLRDYRDGDGSLAGQIGAEPTPQEYVAALLECTREWMRVLKPEGSIFVDLGDKYDSDKSLMYLPERYRIACRDELGLIGRAVIIWSKPNGLPESVTDRVRRSHEDWVHLTKESRYFSAVDEIREPHTAVGRVPGINSMGGRNANIVRTGTGAYEGPNPLGKLPGSVWEVATQPLKVPTEIAVDHFAAFPTEWPRRIILGWSPSGICTACGEGRRPVADVEYEHINNTTNGKTALGEARDPGIRTQRTKVVARKQVTITGYVCACPEPSAPTRPALIVDPFGGTGTTALAAKALGRNAFSFDLSHDYARLADWRTNDPGELARVLGKPKPPKQVTGQIGFDFEEAS
jgi:DNA modification methylase